MYKCIKCNRLFNDLDDWKDLGTTAHPYGDTVAHEDNGIACPECGAENTVEEIYTAYCSECDCEIDISDLEELPDDIKCEECGG